MATEYFSAIHTNALSVFFQFYDQAADKRFDFDDDTWQASPTNPKLAATEKTAPGDANESFYVASMDLSDLNDTGTPLTIVVQAVDDLATDEVVTTEEMRVANGERIDPV